jgi:hypothetical protein
MLLTSCNRNNPDPVEPEKARRRMILFGEGLIPGIIGRKKFRNLLIVLKILHNM